FSCKLCSKAFIQKVTLKYHIGCHVRRGEYHGDPNFLIVNSDNSKNFGLLSDDETAQYLDESFLSSDLDFEGDKPSKHLVVDQNNSNKNCVDNSYLDKNNYGKSNCDKSDDLQIDSDLIKCVSDIDMNFSDLDV
ncbi:uncharacterized protein LOC113233994, partial [Hyposmocoma kahamanoa]|uniref:uncharacterized protein LOC113233994 n=1 Tax=Hyposmocoma kahamanoa TaxID=1477025 RepID=UPI000E6D638B